MIQLALRDSISVYKAKGKVSMLEEVAKDKAIKGIVGIAIPVGPHMANLR